jgi:hypothetical protein
VPVSGKSVLERLFRAERICRARWSEVFPVAGSLALGTLAFAEGRRLSIHPFADFNGRVIRKSCSGRACPRLSWQRRFERLPPL